MITPMSAGHGLLTQFIDNVKPTVATAIGATAVGSNALVLLEQIKGYAALVTVLLGVPTAALVLIYWAVKVWRQIRDNRD